MPLEIGVARVFGMEVSSFDYPEMKSIDSYAHLKKGLELAVRKAIAVLKTNFSRYDYFYIHFKETDIPGHDNKPREKVRLIEFIDDEFFGFLRLFLNEHSARLLVTADHTTSCRRKSHTADPVPVLFFDISMRAHVESPQVLKKTQELGDSGKIADSGKRFTEKDGLSGRRVEGRALLKKTLLA